MEGGGKGGREGGREGSNAASSFLLKKPELTAGHEPYGSAHIQWIGYKTLPFTFTYHPPMQVFHFAEKAL